VPDFETHSTPEPGRLSKLRAYAVAAPRRSMASVVAASKRANTVVSSLLRSIIRRRRATGLVAFCMVMLSGGIAGFVVYRQAFAPEPWPPEYRVSWEEDSEMCPSLGGRGTGCAYVTTKAQDPDSLAFIIRELAHGPDAGLHNYGAIRVYFHPPIEANGFYYYYSNNQVNNISDHHPEDEVNYMVSHALDGMTHKDVPSDRIHRYDGGHLYVFEGDVIY
jgi:hypothetical protein